MYLIYSSYTAHNQIYIDEPLYISKFLIYLFFSELTELRGGIPFIVFVFPPLFFHHNIIFTRIILFFYFLNVYFIIGYVLYCI
jgi:hypothetical protein